MKPDYRFARYSFRAWMAKYRPDGLGHMGVSSMDANGNPVGEYWSTTFTEVICDFCNAEITPTIEVGGQVVDNIVIASDGYALCEDCGEKALISEAKERAAGVSKEDD